MKQQRGAGGRAGLFRGVDNRERGAKRQIEGKEKVGGKNRGKEADEGIDKKKGRDRRGRDNREAEKEVGECAGMGVDTCTTWKGRSRRAVWITAQTPKNTWGTGFPFKLALWGGAEAAGEKDCLPIAPS